MSLHECKFLFFRFFETYFFSIFRNSLIFSHFVLTAAAVAHDAQSFAGRISLNIKHGNLQPRFLASALRPTRMQQAEGLFQFDFSLPIYENLIVILVNVFHFLRSTSIHALCTSDIFALCKHQSSVCSCIGIVLKKF